MEQFVSWDLSFVIRRSGDFCISVLMFSGQLDLFDGASHAGDEIALEQKKNQHDGGD